MAIRTPLSPSKQWIELRTTPEDWAAADPQLLETLLGQGHIIRAFEEILLTLATEGLVHGPVHSSIGQEGGAIGSAFSLNSGDGVNGSHRGHHQFLAKVLNHVSGNKLDVTNLVTPAIQDVIYRTMSEILGLSAGYCGGRGGSMHLQWLDAGALGTNAIVGGGAPLAAGNAFAQSRSGTNNVSVTYFGDGAVNIGSVLESMNIASAWKLPLCFFIENNRYAVSTHINEVTGEPRLSARGAGFAIPSWFVDGMDPLAVHLAMLEANEVMRNGGGPTIIEADVYRYFHQSGPFPGSAFGYRSKEEEAEWKARDPLLRLAHEMKNLGLIDDEHIASVRKQAVDACNAAAAVIFEEDPEKPGKRRIKPALWPDKSFVDIGVRGDASELNGLAYQEPYAIAEKSVLKYSDAVAAVLDRRMETDSRIVILGEDIHRLNGGTNGATKGLAAKYPGRVLGTPISENAFAGLGGGMAMDGRFRPVIEFMYADFMWVAADQVFNQIGKARHMFGGTHEIPVVLRTKVAMGSGYGSQHLMDPAGVFAMQPGWRIIAPSSAAEYIGLMNTALTLNDPVLVLEHVDLYQEQEEVPSHCDYYLPLGRARLAQEGNEATVISYLSMVRKTEKAIEELGMNVDLIDLRWLDRASIDWETIGLSIKKTNNVIIVEQGARGTGYGAWLSDEIQRRFFDYLDQPVQRVTGKEASPSISKVLERAAIAGVEEIVEGLRVLRKNKGEK
jgi:2-oxoisovalerate dehydrogenase E1 component